MGFSMITSHGVTYLASELLDRVQGVRHGFSTRVGGVSTAPYRSLNLGFSSGDETERVQANWKRMLEATGLGARPVVYLTQVHSRKVLPVKRAPEVGFLNAGEADGLYTDAPDVALSVLAADCMPVLIVGGSPARVAAAVHAGWRGVVNGVAVEALERMVSQTGGEVPASEFTVAVGPHIRPCCFEVGPEVVEEFRSAFGLEPAEVRPGEGDKAYLDLFAILSRQLVAHGVLPDRIEAVRHCTRCRPDLFFSYRGEGPDRGMQGATVSLEG